jgi:hypothetical protein
MSPDDRDSFIRWQSVTREHFSSVSNLVLGLATGLLAFWVSGIVYTKPTNKCLLVVDTVSMFLLAASVGLAVWCAMNRLRDFRATAQIARSRYKKDPVSFDERLETKVLGQLSWRLFWWQLVLFGFGAGGVAIGVVARVWAW